MRHHNKALRALFTKFLGNPTVFAIFKVLTVKLFFSIPAFKKNTPDFFHTKT